MKSSSAFFCCWLSLPVWAACGDAVGGPAGGGSGGGGAGSDAGSGGSGGTSSPGNCGGEKCSSGQICRHNECGAPDSEGHCVTVPLDCIKPPTTWEPVCDCDGVVRRYSCNDMDLAPPELCKTFPCGGAQCDIATEYCERQVPADAGQPSVSTCKPVPAPCRGAPTCACTRTEPCGARCMGTGRLGLVLTCGG